MSNLRKLSNLAILAFALVGAVKIVKVIWIFAQLVWAN